MQNSLIKSGYPRRHDGEAHFFAGALEKIREAEMDEHLSPEQHKIVGDNGDNSQNGYGKKTAKSEWGESEISVPLIFLEYRPQGRITVSRSEGAPSEPSGFTACFSIVAKKMAAQ